MASDQSISALIRNTVGSAQRVVKAQVELTQTEFRESGQAVARTGIMAIVAATLASLFTIFLLITCGYGLYAMGLPLWASFGLVTLFLLIATIVCALLAKKNAAGIKAPEVALAELRKTQEMIAPTE